MIYKIWYRGAPSERSVCVCGVRKILKKKQRALENGKQTRWWYHLYYNKGVKYVTRYTSGLNGAPTF